MKKIFRFLAHQTPVQSLSTGYLVLMILGWMLLCIPWFQTIATAPIDSLFISSSAISTTGLASVSISDHYNFFGQLIILILIQIGGLGYMTFGSFVLLTARKKLSTAQEELLRSDFGLPKTFRLSGFVSTVILFTFFVEAAGALGLYVIFKESGISHPLWNAVFHSVSAFCTAGFSLFNNSLEGFRDHGGLNLIIFILSFVGAVGFIAVVDIWHRIKGVSGLMFTTKIIIIFSIFVTAAGWILILITEPMFQADRMGSLLPALFQSMSAMTTVGFNTVPISQLSHGVLYLMTLLMIVGASPAGTGGGIKSTTMIAVLSETFATLRGRRIVTFLGKIIPDYRLQQAAASFTFYIMLLTFGVYLMTLTDGNLSVFDIIFEATSAIGTVGLSTGITSTLSFLGKCITIALMILGRIGPLTIGLAILYTERVQDLWDARTEDIIID